jgi:hypothetical protein
MLISRTIIKLGIMLSTPTRFLAPVPVAGAVNNGHQGASCASAGLTFLLQVAAADGGAGVAAAAGPTAAGHNAHFVSVYEVAFGGLCCGVRGLFELMMFSLLEGRDGSLVPGAGYRHVGTLRCSQG